ncbi:hypothetical protein L915_03812 [Phytophthora nicotianae]|uniref:DUF659 domain-containing protein n=1 Tax=Phytophthora nicotianae TaxID=4792 RepID=W2HEP4_PHYNI|nr:hypothetical protein L915_03812 [Phytophthora nicotianae]ETL46360.1 hypothetical protein L916_03750 [Phytophthora nicotianae]
MEVDSLINLVNYATDVSNLSAAQIVIYACDHAALNGTLASKTRVPTIVCASHRLQLAVQWLLEPGTN